MSSSGLIPLLILLTIALAIPVGMAIWNRGRHQAIKRQAAGRGWRTTTRGWRSLLRPSYRLAGQTPRGAVWELSRFWRDGRLMVEWRSNARILPYGEVAVRGAPTAQPAPETAAGVPLRPLTPAIDKWPPHLKITVTHDFLATFLTHPPAAERLARFPAAPDAGAFDSLTWRPDSLKIVCFYDAGWQVFDQVVDLGTCLVDQKTRPNLQ